MDVTKETAQETPQETGEQIAAAQIGDSTPLQEQAPTDGEAAADRKGYRIEHGEDGEPTKIILDIPEYDPRLDPNSADFDPELWENSFNKMDYEAIRQTMDGIRHTLSVIAGIEPSSTIEAIKNAAINAARIALESQRVIQAITDAVINPDFTSRLQETLMKIAADLPPEELEALQIAAPPQDSPKEAQEEEEPQLSLFEDEPSTATIQAAIATAQEQEKESSPRKIAAAKEEGALVSFNSAAFTTAEEMLTALTRDSIFMLPNETDLQDFDERGEITQLSFTKRPPQHIEVAQTGLFGAMLFAVIASYSQETQENNTVSVYVPELLKALKIEVRAFSKRVKREKESMQELRYKKMLALLQPFDRWIGRFPDGSFYRFLTIESYNPDSETMRLICPYLFEIVRRTDTKRYTFLAHPDIANERNQAAVEIAMRLLQGLQKRGTTTPDAKTYRSKSKPKKKTIKTEAPDGTKTTVIEEFEQEQCPQELIELGRPAVFTYEYSYKNIIRDCPQIRYELEKIENPKAKDGKPDEKRKKTAKQAYNAKLKQTFTAAFRILLEKTDAPLYYKNLHFINVYPTGDYILPTKTTLSSCYIGLQHNGRNRAYKKE